MLKKRLGIEAIEKGWPNSNKWLSDYFKIPSPLIIPDSVEKIGDFAFSYCNNLKEVVIPDGVERIGYKAFEGCKELEKVIVPKSVKFIGDCAFNRCEKATIILQKPRRKFKFIGNCAFYRCESVDYAEEETGN